MQLAPPPPASQRSSFPTWLVVMLVIFGVFVLIAGTLGVLAYAGFRRYVTESKAAEATNDVGAISRAANQAYEDGETSSFGGTSTRRLCGSASNPVPASMSNVSGKKYASTTSDWTADTAPYAGFPCLKFSIDEPQYYQYDYQRTGGGSTPGDSYKAIAHGDLDGDGVTSEFSLGGAIDAHGEVHAATALTVKEREE